MIWLRSLGFMIFFYGAVAFYVLLYLAPALFVHERFVWRAMHGCSKATIWGLRVLCNVRIVFEGLEHAPSGPAIFASKHQATLDSVLPSQFAREPVFVVKRELTTLPLFGIYMKRMIPVDRGGHAKALKDMLRAAQSVLAKGRQIVIFPEGTRQPLGAPSAYKPGIAAIYRSANLPVTPIALDTGVCWPAEGMLRYPGTVTVKLLPPIPAGLSREEFMQRLESVIESASEALLAPHLRRSVAA